MLINTVKAKCLLTWFSNSTDKFFILNKEFIPKLSRVISPDERNEIKSEKKIFFKFDGFARKSHLFENH